LGKGGRAGACPSASIHNTISAAFGSAYVNDFIQAGRVKRVYAQADAPFRMLPGDLEKLYVRNTAGKMVPFSSFASGRWTRARPSWNASTAFRRSTSGRAGAGPQFRRSHAGDGGIVPPSCRKGIGYDWTGLSYQERQAGATRPACSMPSRSRHLPLSGGAV
jgi:HAE1 family hydrophobic/amphiphilic exporter-1